MKVKEFSGQLIALSQQLKVPASAIHHWRYHRTRLRRQTMAVGNDTADAWPREQFEATSAFDEEARSTDLSVTGGAAALARRWISAPPEPGT
jgi:hypothetical protein